MQKERCKKLKKQWIIILFVLTFLLFVFANIVIEIDGIKKRLEIYRYLIVSMFRNDLIM